MGVSSIAVLRGVVFCGLVEGDGFVGVGTVVVAWTGRLLRVIVVGIASGRDVAVGSDGRGAGVGRGAVVLVSVGWGAV